MKHLKTFENRTRKYKYLNPEDTKKVKELIEIFIENRNISEMIENLTFQDFEDEEFSYIYLFDNLLSNQPYNENNIFYVIDEFCKENNISGVPAIRNTMTDIIYNLYKNKYKKILKPLFDEKLIELIKQNPEEYEDIFDSYKDKLSGVVKSECEWMLKYKNYNL